MSEMEEKKQTRLSQAEWIEIVSLFQSGVAISEIADRFDMAKSSIYRGLERRGFSSKEIARKSKEELDRKEHEKLVEKIKKTKEDSYSRIEAIERIAVSLVMKQAKKAQDHTGAISDSGVGKIGEVEGDLKALDKAMTILTKGLTSKWVILGINKENAEADVTVPELIVRELTSVEIETIRRKQRTENDDLSAEEMALIESETELDEVEMEIEEIVTEELGPEDAK